MEVAMSETLTSVVGICVCAALCEQLMDKNRYYRVIRMVLGLRIAGIMVRSLSGIVKLI